jgi:7-cyano-7-deazaguanine synthase
MMLLEKNGSALKYVTLLSGGMDSAVMMYEIHPTPQVAVSVDYGQRHIREIDSARSLCKRLGIKHRVLRVDGITGGCLLDRNAASTGAGTVVPGRNAVLLSLAANVAVQEGCQRIAIGCNASDRVLYYDCHREYLQVIGKSIAMLHGIRLCWPLAGLTKTEIRLRGNELDVPFQMTWSCYLGGEQPCGECGACIERQASR